MTWFFTLTLALVLGMCAPLCAQDASSESGRNSAPSRTRKALPVVPEILSKGAYLTRRKPNLKAKYFGFLRSASWCLPCQIFVPQLLEDYGRMKGAKLEIVLLGQEDETVVKNYMKEHKYNIPGVMPGSLDSIPGLDYKGLGFPSLCIVDAEGNFVAASGGTNMLKWKQQLKEFQAEQRRLKSQEAKEGK